MNQRRPVSEQPRRGGKMKRFINRVINMIEQGGARELRAGSSLSRLRAKRRSA